MFIAKCANQNYFKRQLGERIEKWEKCTFGCLLIGTILVLLIGPFLMFSNATAFSDYNLVQDTSVTFNMLA